ncbi:CoxG family protein [Metabacillus sp. HB246100]|uniref:CoxG family protein n=1 Tax=Bacillus weihaiensis TaxID=1547283 RepID=UPI002357F38F|nr:SRPBCC family protein [Bacillus weihaiensis]
MPSDLYQVEVKLPIHEVWNFVRVIDNWAPLVPGYINHETLNDYESIWRFKTDMGFIKKKVELKVIITNWDEPSKVTFELEGISEKISGDGYFLGEVVDSKTTLMNGYLNLSSDSKLSKMINAKLKKNVSEMTEELTKAVAENVVHLTNTR